MEGPVLKLYLPRLSVKVARQAHSIKKDFSFQHETGRISVKVIIIVLFIKNNIY